MTVPCSTLATTVPPTYTQADAATLGDRAKAMLPKRLSAIVRTIAKLVSHKAGAHLTVGGGWKPQLQRQNLPSQVTRPRVRADGLRFCSREFDSPGQSLNH